MAGRLFFSSRKILQLPSSLKSFRTFLSAAYRCDDAWSKRLDSPLLKAVNANEYAFELERKYRREGLVNAIDVDLFVNRLESSYARNMTQDLEELIHHLRRSPETIQTLPSTTHAALRILLDTKRTKLLLKFLANPLEYGMFPDHYTSNLLMDTYIEDKNYTAAARVSSLLMLNEDFGPPLTQALALASCYSYVQCKENLPWEDYTMKLEEPEEELMIKVGYLRNPYFDDHFDLREPNHIVGKTLAWLAPLISGEVGASAEILGWALYNKWTSLTSALLKVAEGATPVAASVITSVKDIVNSSDCDENREEVLSLISQLESNSKVAELDLDVMIQDLVKSEVSKAEAENINAQVEVFSMWENRREEEVKKQLDYYRQKQLIAEIAQKKAALKAKEEVLFFFENQDKLDVKLMKKSRPVVMDKVHFFPHKIKKEKEVDEDYIPPTV